MECTLYQGEGAIFEAWRIVDALCDRAIFSGGSPELTVFTNAAMAIARETYLAAAPKRVVAFSGE